MNVTPRSRGAAATWTRRPATPSRSPSATAPPASSASRASACRCGEAASAWPAAWGCCSPAASAVAVRAEGGVAVGSAGWGGADAAGVAHRRCSSRCARGRVRFAGDDGERLRPGAGGALGAGGAGRRRPGRGKLGGMEGYEQLVAVDGHRDGRRRGTSLSTASASAATRGARRTGTSSRSRARSACGWRATSGVTLTACRPARRRATTSTRRSRPRCSAATEDELVSGGADRRAARVDDLRRRRPPALRRAGALRRRRGRLPAPRGRRGAVRDDARPRPPAAGLARSSSGAWKAATASGATTCCAALSHDTAECRVSRWRVEPVRPAR